MALLLDTLKSVDFLKTCDHEMVLRFMVLGRSCDHVKGHVFWRVESSPQGIVIPVTGEAKSASRSEEGREFIDRFVGPGECIGLQSTMDGLPHPTNVEVVRKGEFFSITRRAFQDFVAENPSVVTNLALVLGRRYRQNLREREDIALRPVAERIGRFLVEHACVRQDDGAKVLIDATQAEIAARIGTVREVVARVFANFADRGLIERTPNGIFISDWDGMVAAANMTQEETGEADVYGPDSHVRTARFFLSAGERKRPGIANDPRVCREHLGDLRRCREAGCPGAFE